MRRILFLDFDGVINTYDMTRLDVDCVMIYDQATTDLYNTRMARNVERLCQRYGLSIVISSSWREYYTRDELEYILRYMGITAELVGITTIEHLDNTYRERQQQNMYALSRDRGMQISHWLEHNEDILDVESYVVLDDNLYAEYGHEDCFLYCDRDIGFDDDAFARAIEICDCVFAEVS